MATKGMARAYGTLCTAYLRAGGAQLKPHLRRRAASQHASQDHGLRTNRMIYWQRNFSGVRMLPTSYGANWCDARRVPCVRFRSVTARE
jgi:hypothetical protein